VYCIIVFVYLSFLSFQKVTVLIGEPIAIKDVLERCRKEQLVEVMYEIKVDFY